MESNAIQNRTIEIPRYRGWGGWELDHCMSNLVLCKLLEQGSGPLSQSKQIWIPNYLKGVLVSDAVLVRTILPSLGEVGRKPNKHDERQRWARAVVH